MKYLIIILITLLLASLALNLKYCSNQITPEKKELNLKLNMNINKTNLPFERLKNTFTNKQTVIFVNAERSFDKNYVKHLFTNKTESNNNSLK